VATRTEQRRVDGPTDALSRRGPEAIIVVRIRDDPAREGCPVRRRAITVFLVAIVTTLATAGVVAVNVISVPTGVRGAVTGALAVGAVMGTAAVTGRARRDGSAPSSGRDGLDDGRRR
jgi:hypothetical protein